MIAWFVRRSAVVMLVAACIMLFGIVTYTSLPREAAPDVDVPFVIAVTPYPGVSPEDIELLVTIPIERELADLKSLKKMMSTSAEGVSIIQLEFEPEADIDEAMQRVRDRVSRAKPDLPDDIEETDVNEISFAEMPIMIATLAGGVDEEQLKKIAEELEDKIERVPGVLKVDISGGRTRQIRVQIDPIRLGFFGLSLNDVIAAVRDENVNVPGGNVAVGQSSYMLRIPGEVVDPHELENVAIKRVGDRPVFIRDIGKVVDGFADRETYARMNGEVAVSLAISKRTGSNIEAVAINVKNLLADAAADRFPDGVQYRILGDQSKMIGDVVSDLENGIITALILVVGVIMFFMGVRNSLFVAVAIPLSFLLGILIIAIVGMTLNMIVLFSLILVLGMLVDNAIVIVENIYRHGEMGKPARQAAIDGTKEVAAAVAASTATTVAAFVPLIFWTGIMGEFMGYMPKTVVIVLISSLVIAVAVLPVATAKYMKVKVSEDTTPGFEGSALMGRYKQFLRWSIRHRYLVTVAGFSTLFVTCGAYSQLNHGTEFFPETEPNRAIISVRASDGTDIEQTDRIVRQLEAILAEEENVDVYVAEVGVGGSQDPFAAQGATSNQARITVDFLPHISTAKGEDKVRVEKTQLTVDRLRDKIAEVAGAEITIEKENMGPPVGAPIAVEVSGDDFHEVGKYAQEVKRQLTAIEGTAELTDDYRVGRPEMRLRIDRAAAKRVGASTLAIANTIRTANDGAEASTLRDGEDEYDIVVELDPRAKEDLEAILSMRIPGRLDTSPDTFPVPLSTVADYKLAGGSGSIRHIDQKLVVTIQGQIAEGENENAVRAEVIKWIDEAEVPPGFDVRLGGANDEQRAAQEFLSRAFAIAIFLILVVLVTQFNRLDIPLIILASVILSFIGVLWGLVITGTAFGVIMTGLGVISLAGVVVNNAIVLLDYVEQLRERGQTMIESLVDAGAARFRPVILTAMTTILGLVPMAIGLSINFSELKISSGTQSMEWWGPMAVAVIFGLAFATVLTLVMVPTLYAIAEDARNRMQKIKASLFGTPPTPASAIEKPASSPEDGPPAGAP